ncbi:MAG: glycosyltransferase [Gammaproteobacteria bacterium]|nr:MAG: glycosyltransferase [Gammaproteobacteria bacterium]TND03660.1 MAG: glycosyltransferase [Gammaproteobacteria bacterium]
MIAGSDSAASAGRAVNILGVYSYSDAYPNTKFVIDLIRNTRGLAIREICKPLLPKQLHFHQYAARSGGVFRKVRMAARTVYCHLSVVIRYWIRGREQIVYAPYPAVGVLAIFSCLPRFLRPERLVAEAFLSIYDMAVVDRKLLSASSLSARLLKWVERRAYNTATVSTVDTEENRVYYATLFDLPVTKFAVVPLATDETVFKHSPYVGDVHSCHVLFVGTFGPLQGTDTIAKAIIALDSRRDIRITVVGSGQMAPAFSEILGNNSHHNLNWITDWQDSISVAEMVGSADLCLGIFSSGSKADRVWPFKNYAYMACGRPIITGDTACARRMLAEGDGGAFVTVRTDDPQALADKIAELADSVDARRHLASQARDYYQKFLANETISVRLIDQLLIN